MNNFTRLSIFLFTVCTSAGSLLAQYKNVKIDASGNPCKPSIHINPKFPNQVVAGAALDKVYFSEDFGNTWKVKDLSSKFGVFGDPCVIADSQGNFYYFHLSDPEKIGWKSKRVLDRIVCHRSQNGKSWNSGATVGHNGSKQHDKQWAAYDEYSNNIYATWTQFDNYDSENPRDSSNILFSYSKDRGKTWTPSIRINKIAGNCQDGDNSAKGAMPAVGPQGEVYVVWSLNEKIYFDKSVDGGLIWLKKDKIVADQPGGWNIKIPGVSRSSSFPAIACDISYEDYHGNIYVSWADQRNGEDDTDIWIIKSTDKGATWSSPVRVNDDQPGKHQFMSTMTVDQVSGDIYIVFYDRRNHSDNKTDVYMAYSANGGDSFTNVKISEKSFVPSDATFFGDYIDISAFSGYVRPAWTRMDDGKTSIWTAIIDIF